MLRDFSSLMHGADALPSETTQMMFDDDVKGGVLEIICMTTKAATQVITILFAAGLRPRQDFLIGPVFAVEPPLVFTLVRPLTDAVQEQIRIVPNITSDS